MIRCRIAEVAPDSEFERVAFTQIVTAELPDGRRLTLHDWRALGSVNHVGKNVDIEVSVFEYGSLELVPPESGAITGIRQDLQRPEGEVVGRIEDNEAGELRLNFGAGSLALIPRDEDRQRLASYESLANRWARVLEARFDLTRIS